MSFWVFECVPILTAAFLGGQVSINTRGRAPPLLVFPAAGRPSETLR